MSSDLSTRFRKLQDVDVQGGQGVSYLARDASNGSTVFVKLLKHNNNMRARGRFRREVKAYETVVSAGLPTLIVDNSSEWRNRRVQLIMVLELIEGCNLQRKIREDGATSLQEAAGCILALGAVLGECHVAGVAHRDIKPANVMLRSRSFSDPVLVDFGLSFNDDEPNDLTHAEEIGNRFLRLPEHAAEGNSRSRISDVTQLAGLLLYCLTGSEPRVLSDEEGRAPHQRQPASHRLAGMTGGSQLLRLNSLFDRAFDTRMSRRFQDVNELSEAIEGVLYGASEVNSDDTDMRFRDLVATPRHAGGAEIDAKLRLFTAKAHEVVYRLAALNSLQSDQSGHSVQAGGTTPFSETRMRLWPNGADRSKPPVRPAYRFELRGSEIVFQFDGTDLWRGDSADDPALEAAIEHSAKRAFVEAFGDEE